MSDRFSLRIAGVRFVALPPPGYRVFLADPRYPPFLEDDAAPSDPIEIPVELVAGHAPDLRGLPQVVDSGGPWWAARDGSDLLVEFRVAEEHGRYLWVARLNAELTRVVVHCGPRLVQEDRARIVSPLHYPLDQLLMMLLLPHRQGVLVHACGARRGDAAAIFPGHSGAGKSTLMGFVAGRHGISGLSDDRIVVRRVGDAFRAFGTPWAGTNPIVSRESGELRAIAFVHQAPETRLRRISARDALGQLLRTAQVPWFDPERMTLSLGVCEDLLATIPTYELHCRKHDEVAEVVADLL